MADSEARYDVFISYSHQDAEWARSWLLPRLKQAGLRTCIDIENFTAGAPTIREVERATAESRKTLLVCSADYVASEWRELEGVLARTLDPSARQDRVIPLLLGACKLPLGIATLIHADFRVESNREQELTRLVAGIRGEHLGSTAVRAMGSGLMPVPPQPDFAHPYPLQDHFTGRATYRALLTEWLTADDRPVFCMSALAGTGKSALTWAWVQRDVLGHSLPSAAPDPPEAASALRVRADLRPEGILWWSFYERESTFHSFLNEALAYAGGGWVNPDDCGSEYDKAKALLRLLQQRSILLVLDGFERQLRACAGLDAPYQGDAVTEEEDDSRTCTDRNAARFLQQAAALPLRSRVLLTTRLFPVCLEGLGGCRHEVLGDMTSDEAIAFLEAYGINGTRAEKQAACVPYGRHPFSLRLLAGLVMRDMRDPGEIRVAERYRILPNGKDKERHRILEVSYDTLDDRKRALLSHIAAFRGPVGYDAITIFDSYGPPQDFDSALQELVDRGLLLREAEHNRYDLHPIVRRYAYDRLADKTGAHTRLRDYFASVPQPAKIDSLDDLAPVVELFHHTARAGHRGAALDLFRDRLSAPLYLRFGAYDLHIALLSALLPGEGFRYLPLHLTGTRLGDMYQDQAWILATLGNSYQVSGQPRRAEALLASAVDDCACLDSLASTQFVLGELSAAERNLRHGIQGYTQFGMEVPELACRQQLGRVLSYEGAFEEAEQELLVALAKDAERGDVQGQGVTWAYRALRELLMGDAPAALEAAGRARELADRAAEGSHPFERDLIRAGWLHGAALLILAAQNAAEREEHLSGAESHLTNALTRCRSTNSVEFECTVLLARARWHHLKAEPGQARQDAEEALSTADRCEYRLAQADCHNFLARLTHEAGEPAAAAQHAQTAYRRAWCDGPPHCYRPALDEAEQLLSDLGATPPPLA